MASHRISRLLSLLTNSSGGAGLTIAAIGLSGDQFSMGWHQAGHCGGRCPTRQEAQEVATRHSRPPGALPRQFLGSLSIVDSFVQQDAPGTSHSCSRLGQSTRRAGLLFNTGGLGSRPPSGSRFQKASIRVPSAYSSRYPCATGMNPPGLHRRAPSRRYRCNRRSRSSTRHV